MAGLCWVWVENGERVQGTEGDQLGGLQWESGGSEQGGRGVRSRHIPSVCPLSWEPGLQQTDPPC